MSAALQLATPPARPRHYAGWRLPAEAHRSHTEQSAPAGEPQPRPSPSPSMAFYRKHTEKLLRRYLYASMLVGRAPSILGQNLNRGWASYRRLETFEDSVIFVLDVEKCLGKLSPLEGQLIGRIVLQEYSHSEAALLHGVSTRAAFTQFTLAMDRLTEILLDRGMLELPYKH